MRPMVSWAVCCPYDRLYMSTHWYKQAGGFERKKKNLLLSVIQILYTVYGASTP